MLCLCFGADFVTGICVVKTCTLINNNCIIIIIIIIVRYVCLLSQVFLPGTSLEPAVIPTAHASSFTLQYFPYYVWCSKYIIIIIIIIITIIINIIIISFMQGIYTYIPETNCVPKEYSVAAILL